MAKWGAPAKFSLDISHGGTTGCAIEKNGNRGLCEIWLTTKSWSQRIDQSLERAVAHASELASAFGKGLTIITVDNLIPSEALRKFAELEHATVREVLDADCEFRLARARALTEKCCPLGVETIREVGDPVEQIVGLAKRLHPYALVVGRRGRGRLEGLLLRGVSQKVASLAPCPVMVVP